MVDLDVELVVLPLLDRIDQVVVDRLPVGLAGAGRVRLRIKLRQDIARNGVDAGRRDDVAGERLARDRVVDEAVQFGEIPGTHGHRRHSGQERLPEQLAVPLVVGEKEGPIAEQRTTERAAELVLLEVRLGAAGAVVEEVVGVERVVAVELESAPAHDVGARLDLQIHHAAERAAELGRVGRGLQLELVEGVHTREDHHRLQPRLVVVDAVEHEVVVARALAVG